MVVRQVWVLPLVPPRLRTAGGSCSKAARGQSYTALPRGLPSVGLRPAPKLESGYEGLQLWGKGPGIRDLQSISLAAAQRGAARDVLRGKSIPVVQSLCGRRALSVGIAVCSDDGGPYH